MLPRRLLVTLLAGAALGAGCSSDPEEPRDPVLRGAEEAEQAPPPPAPDAPLPRRPAALAEHLTETDAALDEAIERWRAAGGLDSHPPPEDVTLWALHQQRTHLLLTPRQGLADQVLERLSSPVAAHLKATFRARRGLGKITPATPGRYRTGPPEAPARLLAHYRRAQRRFGMGWPVLAAINFVESAFGRLRNSSAAGAQGPMQFIASTWEAYGLGGDINDPRDAILGAANYLHANGAPGRLRNALYRYNPSELYVNAVLAYTERIRRDPERLLGLLLVAGVRARSRRDAAHHRAVTSPAELHLAAPPPFDGEALLGFLGTRAVPGVESFDGRTYRRSIALAGGPAVVELTPEEGGVNCRLELADPGDRDAAVALCRRLLDLDTDPAAVEAASRAGPCAGPAGGAPARPARALHRRQLRAGGEGHRGSAGVGGGCAHRAGPNGRAARRAAEPARATSRAAFPLHRRSRSADPAGFPFPRARGEALRSLARLVLGGELDLGPGADPAPLLAIRGVGPWTASYIAMRALGDPDAWLPGDVGLRNVLAGLGQSD